MQIKSKKDPGLEVPYSVFKKRIFLNDPKSKFIIIVVAISLSKVINDIT